jgi:hypothetical protein
MCALDLTVERLEQTYVRLPDKGSYQGYDYAAPVFDFACQLVYDESGLPLEYPGDRCSRWLNLAA